MARVELIGRRRELERLTALVAPGELVTLTGAGGVGKTRLALAAAGATAAGFADGGWLVELAAAATPDDVLAVVVSALGLFVSANPVTGEAIAHALGGQQRLVLLDNCEHVIDAVTALVDTIMARCPSVAIVATSREALGSDGERVLAVAPLSVDGELSDAARLFEVRVDGLLGGFEPDEVDRAAVGEICRRLDGVPLALELAAARVGALGLHEVRGRLAGRIDSLARRRGGDERHHSLSGTVAWSYELLTPHEQRLFERLAVFADGFDLDAATAVCGYPPLTESSVEDHLVSLIDKSLVTVQRSSPVRYRQLEMVRQFAEDRLSARNESDQTAARLLTYFVDWVTRADSGVRSPEELRWHHAFEAEWNNLRAAINRAIATKDLDAACQIVWHSRWWATMRYRHEIGEWADAVLAMPGADVHSLIPIVGAASSVVVRNQGDVTKAEELLIEAEQRERMNGEAPEPWVPFIRGWHEARNLDSTTLPSVAEMRRRGAGSPFWEALAAQNDAFLLTFLLGSVSTTDSPYDEYLDRVRLCAARAQAVGNPTCITRASFMLGGALRRIDPPEALALLESALATAQSVDNQITASEVRMNLALVYAELDRPGDAVAMLGPAMRQYVRAGGFFQAYASALCAFPALVALGQLRAAYIVATHLRSSAVTEVVREYFAPRRLVARLERELSTAEIARLVERGRSLTQRTIVYEVLQAIEELGG